MPTSGSKLHSKYVSRPSIPVLHNLNKSIRFNLTCKFHRDIKRTSSSDSKSSKHLLSKEPEDSESDDGLEPLPFPNPDDPLSELEDAVEDENFVLDPETGN